MGADDAVFSILHVPTGTGLGPVKLSDGTIVVGDVLSYDDHFERIGRVGSLVLA